MPPFFPWRRKSLPGSAIMRVPWHLSRVLAKATGGADPRGRSLASPIMRVDIDFCSNAGGVPEPVRSARRGWSGPLSGQRVGGLPS